MKEKLRTIKRSTLVIILALSMVVMGLAGCKGSTGSGKLKEVTLKLYIVGNANDSERVSKAVSEYLKSIEKPYSLEMNMLGWGDTYNDPVNLMLSTGDSGMDLCFTANWAASFYENAPKGYFTNLTPLLKDYPDIEKTLTADFMNASLIDGKNYALPVNKEKARQLGWVIREDIAEQMGLDISTIKSEEDLIPWFEKAYNEYNLWVWPNFLPSNYMFDRIEEPIIGTRVEAGTTKICVPDLEPEIKANVKKYNEWFKKGWINPDLTTESSGDTEFATGKYFAITYQLKPGKDAELEPVVGFPLTQITTIEPQIANSETTGAMIAIPNASKNKNEAMDFINLLYTDKNLINLITFGEEGKDYNFVDKSKGIIKLIPNSGYGWGQGWAIGNQFNDYLLESEDPNKWQEFIRFNAAGRPLPALGFVPNTDDVDMQTAIAGMKAVRENYADLFRGYVDDVDGQFAKLEADYKAAGMDTLLAKYQEQFDEFLKNKK